VTVLDARYELGHRIGGGGMAEVVEAYDRKLDRRVAVKLLREGTGDPRAHERFVREAQMAANLVHPNVVTIFDVGEIGGRPCIVMELVEGRTLADLLAAKGSLAVEPTLRIVDGMLAALAAAHDQGLVHRDVKPANVLLARDGAVKLADFGIAKATRDLAGDLTATGMLLGTPSYLSPEQVDGREATPRSDVYAAGIVLYEMLAGVPPFTGDHPVAVAVAHQREPVPPLDERRPGLPPGLVAAVTRALEKDPAKRFADAREMRAAVDRAHEAGPGAPATVATAVPDQTRSLPTPPTPGPGSPRRRWWLSALVGALIAGAMVGGALLLGGGDEPASRAVTGVTQAPATAPPTLATTTTTLPPAPQTVDELIALMAADPSAFGEKGPDLYERLIELRDDPENSSKAAEQIVAEVERWVEKGQLSADLGALTIQIVGPLAVDTSGDEGSGRGNGNSFDD